MFSVFGGLRKNNNIPICKTYQFVVRTLLIFIYYWSMEYKAHPVLPDNLYVSSLSMTELLDAEGKVKHNPGSAHLSAILHNSTLNHV